MRNLRFLARMSDSFQPGKVAQEEFHGRCLPFPEASAVIRRRGGYGGQGPDRERLLDKEAGREHRPRPVRESSTAQSRLARHPHLGARTSKPRPCHRTHFEGAAEINTPQPRLRPELRRFAPIYVTDIYPTHPTSESALRKLSVFAVPSTSSRGLRSPQVLSALATDDSGVSQTRLRRTQLGSMSFGAASVSSRELRS
jgi:hypothetical protein